MNAPTQPPAPDVWLTIAELAGGSVEAQFRHAATAIAKAMRDLDDTKVKGEVTLKLSFSHAKGTGQKLCTSRVSYVIPTETGKKTEEANAETAVYVHQNGHMSVLPEQQLGFEFNKKEGIRA